MESDQSVTRRVLITATALLVGLVAGIVVWQYWPADCGGRFSGMSKTDTGECVGIVRSSEVLDPSLKDVFDKFQTENEAATVGSEYVKVVLLTPLTVAADGTPSAISLDQIRYSLEGAFTAMYRANNSRDFGDPSAVKIQVLLANQGSRQEDNDDLVEDIIAQDEAQHPVVAVVGLGSSFVGTKTIATKLADLDKGIPIVTAVASADSLDANDVSRLRSVSPSNTAYAKALRSFLESQETLKSGIVVADKNNDLYTKSLRGAFNRELASYTKFPELSFTGGTIDTNATPGVFFPVVTNICNAVNDSINPLDMVFYAGRVADFKAFADSLENRTCVSNPLTVLVGATGFNAAQQYAGVLDKGNVTVIYATSADAPAWLGRQPGTPEGFARFAEQFRNSGFAESSLSDGYAIMHHDALVSAASAIRLAAQGRSVPPALDVDTQFSNLNLAYAVRAASGTLSFPDAANGRAVGKLIPIRQIGLKTSIQLPANPIPYVTMAA
jgi:hypothetical protein